MTRELQQLLHLAKNVKMTPQQREQQRQSFAYGNAHIENPRVTKQTVARQAAQLKKKNA